MKASEIEIGTIVRDYNDLAITGKVIANQSIDGDEVVVIEWKDGQVSKENINDLKINKPGVEEDYFKVKEKLTQATILLNEAATLAEKNGDSLADLYNEIGGSDLFRAINNCGWSSSSMRC